MILNSKSTRSFVTVNCNDLKFTLPSALRRLLLSSLGHARISFHSDCTGSNPFWYDRKRTGSLHNNYCVVLLQHASHRSCKNFRFIKVQVGTGLGRDSHSFDVRTNRTRAHTSLEAVTNQKFVCFINHGGYFSAY